MKKLHLVLLCISYISLAQNPYPVNFEAFRDNTAKKLIKTTLRSSNQQLDCSDTSYIYCENFESVSSPELPSDITTSSLEDGYNVTVNSTAQDVSGFYTGNFEDANVGGYWPVSEHTQFAMTNDDACKPNGVTPNTNNNCDLSFEVIQLPRLDFTGLEDVFLIFDYYHDKNYGGGDAVVEVKTADQSTWTDISGNLTSLDDWQEGIFSLSDYNNTDSVNIRIRWSDDGNWASGFAVDNIIVKKLNDNDMSFIAYDHYMRGSEFINNYSIIPLEQQNVQGFLARAVIRNTGNNAQDSVRLKIEVSAESYTDQSWGKNLISLSRDTFFANQFFNFNSAGNYILDFKAESDSTSTQTLSRNINVSEFTFARDDNTPSLSFSLFSATGTALTVEHGNSFDIAANDDLYAVDVYISNNSSPNGKIQAKVYEIVSGTAAFLTESNPLSIVSTDAWQSVKFPTPVPLVADKEYLITVGGDGTTTDTTRIGVSSSKISSYGWRIYNGFSGNSGTAPQDGIYLSIPMVRMNFDPDVAGPISVEEEALSFFTIYPNPNNGVFSLSFDDLSESSSIEIHNILGQLVHKEFLNKHTLTKEFNLSHFEKGIYTVSLNLEGKTAQTQKIIIK